MNIAAFPLEISPFTEVEFEILIFDKRRKCRGVVQPSPRPLLGCVLVEFEVYVEPEFETLLVGDDRMYRSQVQLPSAKLKPISEPAGYGKDLTRRQLRLDLTSAAAMELDNVLERVLGGGENTTGKHVRSSACGWIESHTVRRNRKSGETWEGQQYWLHWEEPGGKKRSKYIPKSKYAAVEESVYVLRQSIDETLKLLEKKR